MQEKTITIEADSPAHAVLLIEAMSADLERISNTLETCCQQTRFVFDPLVLQFKAQLTLAYGKALASERNRVGAA